MNTQNAFTYTKNVLFFRLFGLDLLYTMYSLMFFFPQRIIIKYNTFGCDLKNPAYMGGWTFSKRAVCKNIRGKNLSLYYRRKEIHFPFK